MNNLKANRRRNDNGWFIEIGIHRTFSSGTQSERKQWFNYNDQLNQINIPLHSRRRCFNNIPNAWDDYSISIHSSHERDWKCHTKCRKQWEKNL